MKSGVSRGFVIFVLSICFLIVTINACFSLPDTVNPKDLNLIPFPKQVMTAPGSLTVSQHVVIQSVDDPVISCLAQELKLEVLRKTGIWCDVAFRDAPEKPANYVLTLSGREIDTGTATKALKDLPDNPEGYSLTVTPDFAVVGAKDKAGFAFGIQTLRQLIRANMKGNTIPCLSIKDWPSLKYRGFQDDITRSISPKFETLRNEVQMASFLRMNFFTFYLEHQYAFRKHPVIGPKNGSLTPEELKRLIQESKKHNVEIIGCQQSFGHWATILGHEQYKHLRETDWVVNPTSEDTYKMIDDLFSEQVPLTESPFFNVCCDETYGLGTGPSKPLADQIGVGGVYAKHMKRVHDILKDNYGKRMMMWGDIILQHPEQLSEIPKDTIMLSWGYHAADSFEPAITPFTKSGYDFFVCPGVNNWSRILPDINTAVINIRNYVRDGTKLGAMGMLNTTWDDDGETFFAYNWHGVAWGAECAWNASATSIEDFNRRIGAVLFGESGDHFGQAIQYLSKTHQLSGYNGMFDGQFWQFDGIEFPVDKASAKREAEALLKVVEPALNHLAAARRDATVNAGLLDYFIFAADRMKLMAVRQLALIEAAEAYGKAEQSIENLDNAKALVDSSLSTVVKIRDRHAQIKDRYISLWNRECRPYSLDSVLSRYDGFFSRYDKIITSLNLAQQQLREKGTLPPSSDIGLKISELGIRKTQADRMHKASLKTDAPWLDKSYKKRIGLILKSGGTDRINQPVELDLPEDVDVRNKFQLVESDLVTGKQTTVLSQIEKLGKKNRLIFLAKGITEKDTERSFFLYFDGNGTATSDSTKLSMSDGSNGMKWVENDKIRLLIGPEGGHIYRWEIKGIGNRDVTVPGESDWQGFGDINGIHRNCINKIDVIASGDALVRVRCTDPTGLEKNYSIWAGVPWVEVTLNLASPWLACYDDIDLMGAQSPTPADVLFSDGTKEKIRPFSSELDSQVRRENVYWCAKYAPNACMIALLTPEVQKEHIVGPGIGMGGVQNETGQSVGHYVIYAGMTPESPKDTLDMLRSTLNFRSQPVIEIFGIQWQ